MTVGLYLLSIVLDLDSKQASYFFVISLYWAKTIFTSLVAVWAKNMP